MKPLATHRDQARHFAQRYLALIGCSQLLHVSPSLDALRTIMASHVHHIQFNAYPFIALDSSAVILDPYRCFEEKFSRLQGGICFELNSGLSALLKALGYTTYLTGARMEHIKDQPVPAYDIDTHNTVIVELSDSRYLVDVGLGNYASQPIPFSGECVDVTGCYRISRWQISRPIYRLERFSRKQDCWLGQFCFEVKDHAPEAFRPNVDKVCSPGCHLSDEFFAVKPYGTDSYKIIDGGRGRGLTWIHKSREDDEEYALDATSARRLLGTEFFIHAHHIDTIVDACVSVDPLS